MRIGVSQSLHVCQNITFDLYLTVSPSPRTDPSIFVGSVFGYRWSVEKFLMEGAVPQQKGRHQPLLNDFVGSDDFRASLKLIGWINETLDAAAASLGKKGTREAVIALLILHKSGRSLSGKKLIQEYRSWSASPHSSAVEEGLQTAQGKLIRARLVEVGSIGSTVVSKLKTEDIEEIIGKILEKGVASLNKIRLTEAGHERTKAIRSTIEGRIEEVRKDLNPNDRKAFDDLIGATLPYPPAKPARFEPKP
jgi:hypothetical protein